MKQLDIKDLSVDDLTEKFAEQNKYFIYQRAVTYYFPGCPAKFVVS